MVIPVCSKCQNPIEIVSTSKDGLEIIAFHCSYCQHNSPSFLLGYVKLDKAVSSDEQPAAEINDRAKYFSTAHKRYKLRARVQALQEDRLSNEPDGETEPDEA